MCLSQGDASQGNFGNGENNRNSSSVPKEAAKGFSFASVAVGTWHACGIQDDARAFCWGKLAGVKVLTTMVDMLLTQHGVDCGSVHCTMQAKEQMGSWG